MNKGGSIEKYLESKFVEWCKSVRTVAVKGPAQMYKGIPDRIVALPDGGGTVWVEFKGGTSYQLQPMQMHWRDLLERSNPNRYFVVDTKEDLDALIKRCEAFMRIGAENCEKELALLDNDSKI